MDEFRYDTYCGLYCGACEIMKACRKGLEQGAAPVWDDLPQLFRDVIPQSDLVCRGCKTDTLFAGCSRCRMRICGRERGVDSCFACADYPCDIVNEMKVFLERARDVLPHTRVMFKDAELIKQQGLAAWLRDQERNWSCPGCGTQFSWYQKKCDGCGSDLDSCKDYNKY